ncbi:MAG: glutamine synthetase III [Ndongobacter sp.]|nr:glutamine synthetase III [Ndongobacter sp.]
MSRYPLIEEFGSDQFSDAVMRERLPRPVYSAWEQAIHNEMPITRETADAIAHAMKVWAMERGATHYCHWFQPLNGKTAEKHDAFLQKDASGHPITKLSGKSLMRGETDGSSFPNGGLRDTFEARGYTFWDATSSVFVRGHVLYIPSVFISYTGAKLDLKMPLLTAKQALSKQATRVLHRLGKTDVQFVRPMVGLEQEYFLLDREKAKERPDLMFCGRTLFSADMPKGGDYEDTYFGSVSEEVQSFMREVNEQCWSLGIHASVEHNEFSPGQYEFSSVFDDVTTTIDQNMIVMDILRRVAHRHGMECLLTEKPFRGMNGSGKHNNFSLEASNGDNLFDPGDRAPEDLQFIVFLSAFIEAIDRNQTLLRMACSDAGNDYRLGGHEAPPAIVSVYLGAQLHHLFEQLAETTQITPVELKRMTAPVVTLSEQSIDATDRNRTSPISFGGNRFEIRMLGSSLNASALNTFLFTGMAQSLEKIADQLEAAHCADEEALHQTVMHITHDILKRHHRVLFAGDGYCGDWVQEAERRGLAHYDNYIESIHALRCEETIEMLEHFGVLNRMELEARYQVLLRQFIHTVKTEARTITRMASEGVYPALMRYQIELDQAAASGRSKSTERRAVQNAAFLDRIDEQTMHLDRLIGQIIVEKNAERVAERMIGELRPAMNELSELLRQVELYTPYDVFPYPSQEELVIQ